MNETALSSAIIRQASKFIGLREVIPNAKWDNPRTPGKETELCAELIAMMRPSPWQPGWAYCAAFCEGVVVAALREVGASERQVGKFAKVMGPHCVSAARAFGALKLLDKKPSPGAIWLARQGRTASGHAGIVTASMGNRVATIEANTSLDSTDSSKDREGDWITTRLFTATGRGTLHTLGFVTVAGILELVE